MTKFLTKLRSLLPQLSYLPKAIKLVWQAAGYWTVVWVFLLFIQGILPAIQVYLVKMAIDSFVAIANNNIAATNLTAGLRDIGFLLALILSGGVIGNFNTWVRSL